MLHHVEFIILMWGQSVWPMYTLCQTQLSMFLFLVCFQVSTRAKLSLKILNVDLSYIQTHSQLVTFVSFKFSTPQFTTEVGLAWPKWSIICVKDGYTVYLLVDYVNPNSYLLTCDQLKPIRLNCHQISCNLQCLFDRAMLSSTLLQCAYVITSTEKSCVPNNS